MTKIIPTVIEQIEILQKRNNLRADEVAKAINMPYSTFRRKMSTGSFTLPELEALADYFGYEICLIKRNSEP